MILTPRETQVISYVAEGNTQGSISKLLSVSYDTVNYHIDNIKFKLGAKNTPNAVAIAIRKKIIA